jgi:hypothetical protein
MMNIQNTYEILNKAAQLVELSVTFQLKYGVHYILKPGSPAEAWSLYDQTLEIEAEIAALLDETPRDTPYSRHGKWWLRYDVMDHATARSLVAEAGNLIACTTHAAVDTERETAWSVISIQSVIAGMLHPISLQVGADAGMKQTV